MDKQKDIILLIQGKLEEFNSKELCFKSYPHPKGHTILMIELNHKFYEIQRTQLRKYCSYFINQRVSSSQYLYLANQFDIRYLILPFLEKNSKKYSPLDQIITMNEKYSRFSFQSINHWKLHEICDINDKLGDDMILYRYNENKVLEWLKRKVHNIASIVQMQRLKKAKHNNTTLAAGFNVSKQTTGVNSLSSTTTVTTGSGTTTTTGTEDEADAPSREDLLSAFDILSDYLTLSCSDKLATMLGFNTTDIQNCFHPTSTSSSGSGSQKRKADWEQELELEKETLAYSTVASKITSTTTAAASVSAKPSSALSTAAKTSIKANQVAAKGTKSLLSFFGGGSAKK